KVTTYEIVLLDAAGRRCPTQPDRFTYSFGAAPSDPPLIHSLGIATINNEMEIFIAKGTALPAKGGVVHRNGMVHGKGPGGDPIKIPLVEGENVRRADRNRHIGTLVIRPDRFKRDLPALSEIEITLEVDASRLLRARAYIPVLDEEFEEIIRFQGSTPNVDKLRDEVDREKERLDDLRDRARDLTDGKALEILERIDGEQRERDLEAALDAARSDPDAADKAANRLLDFKSAIDDVEYALEWPALVSEAEHTLAEMRQLVDEQGISSDKQAAPLLERETRKAMESGEADLLWRKVREVQRQINTLYWRRPTYLVEILHLPEAIPHRLRH